MPLARCVNISAEEEATSAVRVQLVLQVHVSHYGDELLFVDTARRFAVVAELCGLHEICTGMLKPAKPPIRLSMNPLMNTACRMDALIAFAQ